LSRRATKVKIATQGSEVAKGEKPDKERTSAPAKAAVEKVVVKVDEVGLKDRIVDLPIEVASYSSLTSVGDRLYYLKRSTVDRQTSFKYYDLDKREEKDLGQVSAYVISADQKKMLVAQRREFAIMIYPLPPLKLRKSLI